MARAWTLITNNPLFFSLTKKGLTVLAHKDCTAHAVLFAARDMVHLGWRLLNHPLYGNFRPGQQPFRSLLLAAAHEYIACAQTQPSLDLPSLELMEQALTVYEQCSVGDFGPQAVTPVMFEDCARIDEALMQATLQRYLV